MRLRIAAYAIIGVTSFATVSVLVSSTATAQVPARWKQHEKVKKLRAPAARAKLFDGHRRATKSLVALKQVRTAKIIKNQLVREGDFDVTIAKAKHRVGMKLIRPTKKGLHRSVLRMNNRATGLALALHYDERAARVLIVATNKKKKKVKLGLGLRPDGAFQVAGKRYPDVNAAAAAVQAHPLFKTIELHSHVATVQALDMLFAVPTSKGTAGSGIPGGGITSTGGYENHDDDVGTAAAVAQPYIVATAKVAAGVPQPARSRAAVKPRGQLPRK